MMTEIPYEVTHPPEFHDKNEIPVSISYKIVAIRKIVECIRRTCVCIKGAAYYYHMYYYMST